MTRQILLAIATLAVSFSAACTARSTSLVPVGDPGNVADPLTGYGAVSYSYSIGEYDVTMGQYTAFLNSVATTSDPYGLWTASMSSATPTYGITRTSTSGKSREVGVGKSGSDLIFNYRSGFLPVPLTDILMPWPDRRELNSPTPYTTSRAVETGGT